MSARSVWVSICLCAVALLLAAPRTAHAFCGFYVSGADASLYNDATMVVLMREGQRTVLSMQNNYQGPPEDFAMVVPVPIVLREENVKTLERELFQHVDQLAAPRLVEYWEQDPCFQPPMADMEMATGAATMAPPTQAEARAGADLGVTVEAQFAVAEYDIVVLSARDSTGLDTWLRRENYNIPSGADRVLRPYVEAGTKFFVAKVDVERVTFVEGRAVLSPLRVHYDAPEFSLPVRLGLLNSQGQQDLIVHVLGRGQRFEVANYPNAFIPTNIRVVNGVREEFGGFYEALFRQTIARHENAVVTEYSWDAGSCDPCPTPALDAGSLMSFGADVLGGNPWGFVLTRLHYRYSPESLGEDLVFRPAPAVIGGRGIPDTEGNLTEEGAQPSSTNNFQGRYVILHWWEGALTCQTPNRGQWGGPPTGGGITPVAAPSQLSTGRAAQPAALGALVAEDIPEIGVVAGQEPEPSPTAVDRGPRSAAGAGEGGCASCATGGDGSPWSAAFVALAVIGLFLGRRRN